MIWGVFWWPGVPEHLQGLLLGDRGRFLMILGGFWESFWKQFWSLGTTLEPPGAQNVAKRAPFVQDCFRITFLGDFRPDSGRLGTAKTGVSRWRGCKNQVFMDVGFLKVWGSVWETF